MESPPRILIVDDKESNLRLLKSTLEPMGYDVSIARNGREALERTFEDKPDLVVLDVLMPGMTGFEVVQQIRTRPDCQSIPVLMLTALSEVRDKVRGLDAGADDFLTKPFHPVELLARVRSLLRIKQLHDELQAKNSLLERILMRYISEEVAREIMHNPDQNLRLGGQSCEVSVLFADIRGFSHFSEKREAAQVTQVLNNVFNQLSPAVFEYRGTLDKYLGDAIMAFYGAPIPSPNNAEQAVRTAWAMMQRFARLCQDDPGTMGELGLGVGISTGEAVVGNVGSERIMDYTVIGRTPNTAKRLQENAQAGQILIDERAYQNVRNIALARPIEPLHLKGYTEPVQAFEVLAVQDSIEVSVPRVAEPAWALPGGRDALAL